MYKYAETCARVRRIRQRIRDLARGGGNDSGGGQKRIILFFLHVYGCCMRVFFFFNSPPAAHLVVGVLRVRYFASRAFPYYIYAHIYTYMYLHTYTRDTHPHGYTHNIYIYRYQGWRWWQKRRAQEGEINYELWYIGRRRWGGGRSSKVGGGVDKKALTKKKKNEKEKEKIERERVREKGRIYPERRTIVAFLSLTLLCSCSTPRRSYSTAALHLALVV